MKLCLPNTFLINDLFRCLCADIGIEFVAAPAVGKYTRQIGKAYAAGTLCEGLEIVLGSISECRFLGADTAVVFAPCGGCSAQRIKSKLENCLHNNAVPLQLLMLEDSGESAAAFWKQLRAHSAVSFFAFREAKRRFAECRALLPRFAALRREVKTKEVGAQCTAAAEKALANAKGLLDFKLLLSLYTKKFAVLSSGAAGEQDAPRLPYTTGDYFALENGTSCGGEHFFGEKSASPSAWDAAPKCPVNGETAVFVAQKAVPQRERC